MIKKDCFAYNDEKNECNACKDLKCQNCAFYKEKGKIEQQEKKDELLTKIKDILALNYSYQEIGIKIERLFKEELK